MPPLPPVQARPPPRSSQSSRTSQSISDLYDAEARDEMSLATLGGAVKRKKSAKSNTRSARQSTSGSPTSPATAGTPLTRSHSEGAVGSSTDGSPPGGSANGSPQTTVPPVPTIPPSSTAVTASGVPISSPSSTRSSGRASLEVRAARSNSVSSMLSKRTAAIQDLAAVSTMIGERSQIEMFPIDALLIFDLHSLCLHLRRSLGVVLAVREAMWEELQSLVTSPRSDVDLDRYGFYVHEDTMESMRAKYVQLLDQYKRCVCALVGGGEGACADWGSADSDMHVRMSLWSSLVHFGWDYPQRDPMSKAEEMEELRLREDILLARRQAGAENEREPPCRAVRVLVGAKG